MVPECNKLTASMKYPAIDPTNPANSAAGKTVLVTGGASGIGLAIVRAFAAAGASSIIYLGRRVAILDETSRQLREDFPRTKFKTYAADVMNREAIENMFAELRSGDEDVDILVLNAAYTEQGLAACAYSPEEMRQSFDTNVLGNMNLVRGFLGRAADTSRVKRSRTIAGGHGGGDDAPVANADKVIIDVSTASAYLTIPLNAIYGASKAAFTHMMQHVQLENPAVRVHSFNPGIVYTEGMAQAGFAQDHGYEWDDASLSGGFAVWLASPAAAFLSGRFVFANWDVEEMMEMKDRFQSDERLCRISLNI